MTSHIEPVGRWAGKLQWGKSYIFLPMQQICPPPFIWKGAHRGGAVRLGLRDVTVDHGHQQVTGTCKKTDLWTSPHPLRSPYVCKD